MNKTELLAPAGNLEKLKYAIEYGADAVYCGIPEYSLRVRINQFSEKTLEEAARYAHKNKKKIYVTLNIYAHNRHLAQIERHLKFLKKLSIDGIIISDSGIINLAKKNLPGTDIHLSTQANATNWQAVKFWRDLGVKRIILAREVSLSEIKEIKKKVKNIELEYFIHGAMCMSYSGRCILSAWMSGRSANLGDCTQPCRWAYRLVKSSKLKIKSDTKRYPERSERSACYSLKVSEKLKGYEVDLEEDRHGTYFFNSYDLNLIEYVKDLIDAGVDCLKIEGRSKSAYYTAVTTRAYRKVIDTIGRKNYKKNVLEQKRELNNLANRGYTTGFLLDREPEHNFSGKMRNGKWKFVGEVIGAERGINVIKVHNEIYPKDKLEMVTPEKNIPIKIRKIYDDKMREIKEAHGGHDRKYYVKFDRFLPERSLIRKKIKQNL